MDNELNQAFKGLTDKLDIIIKDLENIEKKVDRIDQQMAQHSVKIGELNKDVEHLQDSRKEIKNEVDKNIKTMWDRMDEKATKENLEDAIEKIEEKMKAFIWKLFASAAAAILLNFLRDILWTK